MKIQILREAVCAADDQVGPLEKAMELSESALLSDLVDRIKRSRFLQFSSSHTAITAYAGDQALFRLFSPHHSKEKEEYLVSPDSRVKNLIHNGIVEFKF